MSASQLPALAPRFFVLTDISDEEPDDQQSLVRLLLYACDIEIEGLVACSSQWKAIHHSPLRPEYIHQVLDAYAQVEDALRLHRPEYPSASSLRQKVAVGNGNDMLSVGDAFQTEGSELLRQRILAEDPRPLWVGIWGGASTLAQALWTLRKQLPREELRPLLHKLWVYDIQGQDDAGAWIATQFPEIQYMRNQYAWRGISRHVNHEWFESRGDHEELVSPAWFRKHIQEDHGPLGAMYPDARYLHEGDTASFLHLLHPGLHDPCEPDQGGWGGRFHAEPQRNVWSGGCPVTDEQAYGDFFMYSDAADRCIWQCWEQRPTCNVYNSILRWRKEIQQDFAARMDWCILSPEEANYPPHIVLNGDRESRVMRLQPLAGTYLELDASSSWDPQGYPLYFKWWMYEEAGNYPQPIHIECDTHAILGFRIPHDAGGRRIHLILHLSNGGQPPLCSYRRVILCIS